MTGTTVKTWQIYAAGIAACTALATGIWFTLIGPTLAQLEKDDAARHELAQRHEKAADLNASLVSTRRQLTTANETLAHSTLKLQPASDLNARLAKLTDLATSCGLTIDEMHPGTLADASKFQTLPVHMAGSGSYPDCAKFLHTLRQSFPDTGVEALEATNPNPTPQGAAATFRLDLVWYTKK
jgi:Tfp pilus assembly protein PilO